MNLQQTKKKNYEQLKNIALAEGASLFAVADLKKINLEVSSEISPLLAKLDLCISVGVELSDAVLDTIIDKPTLLYSWHYRQVNTLLDHIALGLSRFIQSQHSLSLPVAASQVVDWKAQKAHLSHKHLAKACGLGWIGRNNLLINEKYGSRLRLVSILTDMPLISDPPGNINCRQCRACISVCPAQAIKEKLEDFQHQACFERLKEFSRLPGIKYHICGICVKACKGEA